ncbi:MAG: glycerol-3-phosphate 1-O-acyltransferase PlsY [Opitutaceae bacterium]|nr:glycerol-3-phosphate 1-O-acyltransferase PlsY [Opitutaceae bacterium]
MFTSLIIALVIGYFLGSLPFGYLVARSKGVNIFEVGSKNPGATNVRRVLGSGPGNVVFALDALKGAAATMWPFFQLNWSRAAGESSSFSFSFATGDAVSTQMAVAGLVGALLGHSFSCFTKFRGGKGVATASGGLLVLMPLALAIGAAVWAATFYSSRYVSLASILAALSMPISAFALKEQRVLLGLTIVIALLVVLRHRTNIQRLLNGTEGKFVQKTAVPKS